MKILIWSKDIILKNCGGPSGYLYNIKEYFEKNPCENIDFYPEPYKEAEKIYPIRGWKLKFRNVLKWIGSPIRFLLCLKKNYYLRRPLSSEDKELLEQYDCVHVHYLSHYLQSFMGFNNGHTRTILTTHNPEPLIDQLAGEYRSEWMLKIPGFRNYFIKKEISAYEASDFIMFPVEQAREPYINRSDIYKKAFEKFEKKFFYVPTCLNTTEKNVINEHVLDKYQIPKDALKVCYVGRHTSVKGYDTIQTLAKQIWHTNSNIYFIIGGKEQPIRGIKHPNWIELGWVNTQSLLNEVDVFILPNKDTYFDLILLEVLRQGTPTVLTRTGGNKWFEGKTDGLFFYNRNGLTTAKDIILNLYELKQRNEISQLMKSNIEFFKYHFDMSLYINHYLSAINNICIYI